MNARDAFRITGMAAALLAAFGPARAAEIVAPYGQLNTAAGNTVSVGIGYSDNDGRRFGQYNGVNESGGYGLLDFSLVKRNEETGTWLGFYGRNVGLDNRQLRFEQSRQGNWGYFVEYSQSPRYEPYTVTTAVSGIGTSSLNVPGTPTAGNPFNLKTQRDNLGLGFDKFLFGSWDMEVRFRNEEKDGSRIFGRGTTGGGPAGSLGQFEFTPEPINSTTRQLDVKLNYSGTALNLTGGYYGTMFNNNQVNGLSVTGGLAGLATFTPLALAPDNQSHQLYLSGSYGFTPTTHGNFKVAYAKQIQEDAFVTGVNVPLSPGVGTNLQGKVDTTLLQGGITSRPMPKLTLLANFRYEDRDEKTPVLFYLTPAPATSDGANEPRSVRTTNGKLEASYALGAGYRLIGGIDYEEKKRNTSPVRIVSYRETTDEISYRAELRRAMSDTVTGAVSYIYSDRGGSPWIVTTQTGGALGSNLVAPLYLADRTRDKVRLSLNWTPADPLTISFFADDARDNYSTNPGSTLAPMSGKYQNYSVDASYAFSDKWQASAWYTWNNTTADQTTCVGASSSGVCGSPTWAAKLKNSSNNIGAGLHGKPNERLQLGADLTYSDIKDVSQQAAVVGAPITTLPDITTRLTRVNLFAKYALQKNSGLRFDYIYDHYSTDDWTWATWTYADGTTVTQNPNQKVNFVGFSYYYKWQ